MKSFIDSFRRIKPAATKSALATIENTTKKDVAAALERTPVTVRGFLALLSDVADGCSDKIENAARILTKQRFGRIVNLYIPLYLTNACVNNCLYCGFGSRQTIERKTLSIKEVVSEGKRIFSEGYRSVLLVAGEDKKAVSVEYLAEAIYTLKKLGFVFVGIEVAPLSVDDYKFLGKAGLDSVTIYQETYDPLIYGEVHPSGPKKDFEYRLATPERVAIAGIRSINIGFLLGLADFKKEAILLVSHLKYLQKKFWQTAFGVSFPRIHKTPEGFKPKSVVPDNELVRLIMAMRLYNPDVTLTLSTREAPPLRDRLFGAGVNQVSAGSKTSPGAYVVAKEIGAAAEQFPVVDDRTPAEVMAAISASGYESVFKDWDPSLKAVS